MKQQFSDCLGVDMILAAHASSFGAPAGEIVIDLRTPKHLVPFIAEDLAQTLPCALGVSGAKAVTAKTTSLGCTPQDLRQQQERQTFSGIPAAVLWGGDQPISLLEGGATILGISAPDAADDPEFPNSL